ncbi:MAG: hypothetical protein LBT86_01590 [Deltaproteobacteria bacterium]|jgi:hypothetical protein|nr:hypothetical protein [Deltaproteobacteria bacterium]
METKSRQNAELNTATRQELELGLVKTVAKKARLTDGGQREPDENQTITKREPNQNHTVEARWIKKKKINYLQ